MALVGTTSWSYCTLSSLLMPTAFAPKLKKTSDERRRKHALLGPTRHTACYSFKGHCIKPHHILQAQLERESKCHCADKETEAQGGWGSCPARGSTQVSRLPASGPVLLIHTVQLISRERNPDLITRILTLHNSPCHNPLVYVVFYPTGSTLFSYSF